MKKNTFVNRAILTMLVSLVVIAPCADAFARGRDRGRHNEVVVVGRDRYHYRDGRFYRPSWFGFEFRIGTPPVGAVVANIPFGHTTLTIGSVPYYYYDRAYYRRCPSGYIVVQDPVIVTPGYAQSGNEVVIINVPNASGGYTQVRLVRSGNGYVGPQGEYYPGSPSIEQLRVLYGR